MAAVADGVANNGGGADLIVVWGDPAGVLEPGQSMVLAHEITVERNLRTQTRVSAEPVDQDGNRVEGREVASTTAMSIEAVDPGGLPGFRDALDASVEVFLFIGGLFVLAAGLLPVLLLVGLLAALWIWISRRGSGTAEAEPPWNKDGEPEPVRSQDGNDEAQGD